MSPPDISRRLEDAPEVNDVSGQVVSSLTAEGRGIRFELKRRHSAGTIDIRRFRQARDYLWWYKGGITHADLRIDGHPIKTAISSHGDFTYLPAGAWVDGSFQVEQDCEYAFVTFDNALVLESLGQRVSKPLSGFGQTVLKSGVEWLSGEMGSADRGFRLFLDGWGQQALGIVSRMSTAQTASNFVTLGGLSPSQIRAVDDYLALNLHKKVALASLARTAGCSIRHFQREFQETRGMTPMRYLRALRIDRARKLLAEGRLSLTAIAEECGFGYVQHFVKSFKDSTGLTPGEYRRLSA
jgi:AraC family transcriptional regulator